MKISLLNKIFLGIEIVPTIFVLLLSLMLLAAKSKPLTLIALLVSISSMVSLIYLIVSTIKENNQIEPFFIYLAHSGMFILFLSIIAFALNGFEIDRGHHPSPPLSMFIVGIVNIIPYLHVMIINNFYRI